MKLKEITEQEFNNFITYFPNKSLYQTAQYGYVMRQQGYETLIVGLEDEGLIKAASLILVKKVDSFKYAYAPRGFLIDFENYELVKIFTNFIKDYLNKLGIVAIKITPLILRNIFDFNKNHGLTNSKFDSIYDNLMACKYYHLGFNNYFEALKPRFEGVVNISGDINEVFDNVSKDFKTKIRSASRNSITTYKGNASDLKYLADFIQDTYERDLSYLQDCFGFFKNSDSIDLYYTRLNTTEYLREVQKKFNEYEFEGNEINKKVLSTTKNRGLIEKKINIDKLVQQYSKELVSATDLLREYPEGIVTSAALVIRHFDEAYVLVDGYDKNLQRLNSKHLMMWDIISSYNSLGIVKFNFGGMSNPTVDLNQYVGLNKFKMNFGCKVFEYAGDFELVISKTNYALYRNYLSIKNLMNTKKMF